LDERLRESSNADQVVLNICGLLARDGRDRLPLVSKPSFLRPSALRRMIPLVYRHVRVADDIERAGKGVYSPNTRDHAQEFRGGLLTRLEESDDAAATYVLRELLAEDVLASHHDWIRHLLNDRLATDAEMPAWEPRDVRTFANDFETDPKTDRDLFRIICNRLRDIKYGVEKSDNSLREEVQTGGDEYVLRRFLARKLNEWSRQRYTIPQEEEIDLKQRPDLRAENPRTDPCQSRSNGPRIGPLKPCWSGWKANSLVNTYGPTTRGTAFTSLVQTAANRIGRATEVSV
jgi:hypothetical protein